MKTDKDKYIEERIRNAKKINLIDNLDNFNLSPNKKRAFIKFYYENLDMNLEKAFALFKKS